MKKSFIYNCLPLLFAAMATFSFTACGGGDGDDTDYAAIAAMQGMLSGGGITVTGEAIDLGLSVKWASCNVGATQPWEYGGYYAWGETEEKSYYGWNTYKYYQPHYDLLTKYCTSSSKGTVDNKRTLEPTDDVATVKWGGAWRMPTLDEIKELTDNCKWIWTTLNGVNGCRVTGPNGNSIFLPAAGRSYGTADPTMEGMSGYYWSKSINDDDKAYHLGILNNIYGNSLLFSWSSFGRPAGHSVRPVCP